jgi:hypothetical protein
MITDWKDTPAHRDLQAALKRTKKQDETEEE